MRSHTAQAAWREVLGELGWQHDGLPKRKTTYLPCLQHHAREPRASKPPPLQPINRGSGSPLLPWPANRNHNLAKTANLSVKFQVMMEWSAYRERKRHNYMQVVGLQVAHGPKHARPLAS